MVPGCLHAHREPIVAFDSAPCPLSARPNYLLHFLFFIVVLTVVTNGVSAVKRIRRRGKQLVPQAHIASTNTRNEFGRVVVRRDTPFRSATNDVGQALDRCNIDFQFMPRTLDDEALADDSAEQPAVCEVDPRLALAMYGVRRRMRSEPLLRRIFHSMVAMFQAAHNCDYYITKYCMCEIYKSY